MKNNIITPKGTKDILFSKAKFKRKLENVLLSFYENFGYKEIITPLLEYSFIFENTANINDSSYKLIDNQYNVLVLRPDCTTPIARVIGSRLSNSNMPLKLCYNQNIYRNFKQLYGKQDEYTQSGIELVGVGGLKSDFEVLYIAITALKNAGINDFKIELGHVGIFKSLTENAGISEEDIEKVRTYIENKNKNGIMVALSEYKKTPEITALLELSDLFGGYEIFTIANRILKNTKAYMYIDYLKNIYNQMKALSLEKYITIDLGLVHHINYYTGIVFRGYTPGCGDSIITGGRYDNLISKFGASLPAVGFAVQTDLIVDMCNKNNSNGENEIETIIYFEKGFDIKGYKYLYENKYAIKNFSISPYESLETTNSYAKDMNCNKIICIGEKIKEINLG